MAGSLNKVQVIGNLGKDPEIRYTGDNRAIANLTVATSENWMDKSGSRQEKTEWHRIVVFGKLAETIEKYLKKGDSVYFEGKLQTRKWQGNDGQDRYTTEIVVDMGGKMVMLGSNAGASMASPSDDFNQDTSASKPTKAAAMSEESAFDDEIPF